MEYCVGLGAYNVMFDRHFERISSWFSSVRTKIWSFFGKEEDSEETWWHTLLVSLVRYSYEFCSTMNFVYWLTIFAFKLLSFSALSIYLCIAFPTLIYCMTVLKRKFNKIEARRQFLRRLSDLPDPNPQNSIGNVQNQSNKPAFGSPPPHSQKYLVYALYALSMFAVAWSTLSILRAPRTLLLSVVQYGLIVMAFVLILLAVGYFLISPLLDNHQRDWFDFSALNQANAMRWKLVNAVENSVGSLDDKLDDKKASLDELRNSRKKIPIDAEGKFKPRSDAPYVSILSSLCGGIVALSFFWYYASPLAGFVCAFLVAPSIFGLCCWSIERGRDRFASRGECAGLYIDNETGDALLRKQYLMLRHADLYEEAPSDWQICYQWIDWAIKASYVATAVWVVFQLLSTTSLWTLSPCCFSIVCGLLMLVCSYYFAHVLQSQEQSMARFGFLRTICMEPLVTYVIGDKQATSALPSIGLVGDDNDTNQIGMNSCDLDSTRSDPLLQISS